MPPEGNVAQRFVLVLATMGVILISTQLMTAQRQEAKQPESIAVSELRKKLDSGERFLLIGGVSKYVKK